MFCPECGNYLEDVPNFCTHCGCSLSKYRDNYTYDSYDQKYNAPQTDTYRSYEQTPLRKNKKNKFIAVFIVIIMVLACGMAASNLRDEGNSYKTETITVGEYSYDVNGAFTNNEFTIENCKHEFNGTIKDCISITLNGDLALNYGWFQWKITDKNSFVYVPFVYNNDTKISTSLEYNSGLYDLYHFETNPQSIVEKSESVLYWVCSPGEFSISVSCFTSKNVTEAGKIYSGDIDVLGDIIKDYSWKYNNNMFSTQISFSLDEFKEYSDKDPNNRQAKTYSASTKYVIVDDTIRELSSNLTKLYIDAYSEDADLNSQKFADYLLSFVQYCFKYPANNIHYNGDEVMYGKSEYFAYPIETIYSGYGDCEDTTILLAAIYTACGYNAAICIIPGHAMAGVALEDYSTPDYSSKNYTIIKQTINGKTYYGGETTVNSHLDLGLSTKNESGQWYASYIGKNNYGFYPV